MKPKYIVLFRQLVSYLSFFLLYIYICIHGRENNPRYFIQRQGQQTNNQSRVNVTFGSQQQVKPADFRGPQKPTPFIRQQNNGPSENAVPVPAQTRDMNVIFTNTMQQLSHVAKALITALDEFFRQSFSENMKKEEPQ